MKTKNTYLFMLLPALLLQACGQATPGSQTNNTIDSIRDSTAVVSQPKSKTSLNSDEQIFITTAATGGLMEVEAANAAIQLSKNKDIKAFATQMLKDHGKANTELAKIAKSEGITLPAVLPNDLQMHLKDLKNLNDQKFDKQYITMMIADHDKTVTLLTEGTRLPTNTLMTFAAKTLPVVAGHYKEAVRIGKTLNLSNVGRGDDPQGMSPAHGQQN